MSNQEFINYIAPIIQNENKKRGNPLFNSVIIAQACHETGFGKSQIMMKANAPFGIKAFESWKGKTYSSKTKEVYDNNPVTIDAKFRAYDTIEQGINDYLDLITKSERYRKALVADTPRACIEAIKNGGYATDPSYVASIMSIINLYNLQKYDNVENITNSPYQIGKNYTLQVNLNVRRGAGTYYEIKKYSELTPNGKIHATNKIFATLKKGTIVTCQDVIKNGQDIWLKIPSGYICANYGGKVYVS